MEKISRTACLILMEFLFAEARLPAQTNVAVESQPLIAAVDRVVTAMENLGSPLDGEILSRLHRIELAGREADAAAAVQTLLDPLCLATVEINPEARVQVRAGLVKKELVQGGWRTFLVKVINQAGVTAALQVESRNALPLAGSPAGEINQRWLDLSLPQNPPLSPALSGLTVEYRLLQLYSRDAGQREATLSFNIGEGTQDLGFRGEIPLLFDCRPAHKITLHVTDENDQPTTGCFAIKDAQGRVYPAPAKRLAPDFSFQTQVYRADGETIALPDGDYTVEFSRGPESLVEQRKLSVRNTGQTNAFQVRRWIDPALFGWWSGDHHIHAAGCAHYSNPTQGVQPADMMRHCLGEDLKVGCNLTWGPCFDYQKQFFCGSIDPVSQYPYLLRYDIEVSGFGSHQSGHLCLLRLREENYPGGNSTNQWPTLGLNTLKWAKKQGAITGTAHSGYGLKVAGAEIPNYRVPLYNGIGANEFIVDITHEVPGPDGRLGPAVDFYSLGDTPPVWELSMWYHVLNAGFRPRASGETDFPCILAERVGMGRTYVKLPGRLDFDSWCEGLRLGRSYVSDGRSHLLDFRINDHAVGEAQSEVQTKAGSVHVTAQVAALLPSVPPVGAMQLQPGQKPFWHLERARMGKTRSVPLEVIVNGTAVTNVSVLADGVLRPVAFDLELKRSGWVALRILGSSHSNPIWVLVDGQLMAPSRRDTAWCLAGVDQCWAQKKQFIRAEEMGEAVQAYDHARGVYRKLMADAKE